MSLSEQRQHQLGEALKSLRQARKLTADEVAARMDEQPSPSAAEISRWERGDASPRSTQLWSYLAAIDASFADLDRALNPEKANPRLDELTARIEALAPPNSD